MSVAWIEGTTRAIRLPTTRSDRSPASTIPKLSPERKTPSASCSVSSTTPILSHLNPQANCYEAIKRLSDCEVLSLALLKQLRGVESERSLLSDAQRFFAHLFPAVVGVHPSSLHRRVRRLRRFMEPLRRAILAELVGDPKTLIVDSTLLEVLHPRQLSQSAGFEGAAWVRWGSFSV